LIITGNLTVSGNSTTLNTEVLTVEDAEVVLLSNVASTPALNAGVIVNRGTSANTFLRWDEALDEWGWSDSGNTTYYFEDLRAGLATTNTTFGTVNTSLGTINTSYQAAYAQANTARNTANSAYGQANTATTNAGNAYDTANSAFTASSRLRTDDTRTIAPSTHTAGRLTFGFTSYTNNGNASSYADYLHFRSYTDSSGGSDNLVMFHKSGIGMRIWQQTWNSSTAYSNYVDVLHSSNYSSYAVPLSGGTMTGTLIVNASTAEIYARSSGGANGQFLADGSNLYVGPVGAHGLRLQTNGTTRILIDSSGNVGIANTAPLNKLQIGSGGTSGFSGNDLMIGNGTQAMAFYQSATESAWYTNTRFALMPSGAGATGNVGIGTTTPAHKLDVNGTSIFRDTLNFGSGALISWTAGYSDGTTQTYNSPSSGSLALVTNSSLAIFIKSNQNVGIGTASPSNKLDVIGNVLIQGTQGFNATDETASLYIGDSASEIRAVYDRGLDFYQNGTHRMRIQGGTGNVGIGMTEPAYKLHVRDATNTGNIAIGHVTYPGVIYSSAASGEFRIDNRASSSSGYITFYPNGQQNSIGNEAMRINTNGRVGIANTNPERTLHVEGISYNRGEIIRPTVYGGDNSGTNSTIGSYILGAGKYWTVSSGAKYVHILLPARYNANAGASLMWCIEVKGYDFNAARIINLMIGGYVTPVSNGGPMSQIAAWDSAGSGVYSPTAYFSSNYNRGVARFYLSSSYYASFTINTIASGNGDVIAPDELTIIESVNATI
jgi:hypothetical protein